VKFSIIAVLTTFCAIALPSCQPTDKPNPDPSPPEPASARKLIGRVSSAPTGENFILIRSFTGLKLPIGTVLTTHGSEGRIANLVITGEAQGNFAAADIQSGTVEVGDSVYLPNLKTSANDGDSPEQTHP